MLFTQQILIFDRIATTRANKDDARERKVGRNGNVSAQQWNYSPIIYSTISAAPANNPHKARHIPPLSPSSWVAELAKQAETSRSCVAAMMSRRCRWAHNEMESKFYKEFQLRGLSVVIPIKARLVSDEELDENIVRRSVVVGKWPSYSVFSLPGYFSLGTGSVVPSLVISLIVK